jgi:hypothetical protein
MNRVISPFICYVKYMAKAVITSVDGLISTHIAP